MRGIVASLLAASACLFAVAVQAQSEPILGGVRAIPEGVAMRSPPGRRTGADLYAFATLPGDKQKVVLALPATAVSELQVLDPGGNIVAHSWGKGPLEVEFIPAWGDVYTVAVFRKAPTVSYTVTRTATPGTLPQFVLAHMTGYRRLTGLKTLRCWTNPGRTIRRDFGDYQLEQTVNGDGLRSRRIRPGRPAQIWDSTLRIDGDAVEIADQADGTPHTLRLGLNAARLRYDKDYVYVGQIC